MKHRGLLLGFVFSLVSVGGADAQDAPRRPHRRAVDSNAAYMGGGMIAEAPVFNRTPQNVLANRTEIAPMPNNGIEAPRGFRPAEAARVTPGMISPTIPGRGLAQENGSPGSLQDRLFRPAPGAHLRIPMSW